MTLITKVSGTLDCSSMRFQRLIAALIGACFMISNLSLAQQIESTAFCDEGGIPPIAEPVPMVYGDHTEACLITPNTDSDLFRFEGMSGDLIKINVDATTNGLDISIEVRDNVNSLVGSASCTAAFNVSCSLTEDFSLTSDGTHTINVSDLGANDSGSYIMQLERIFPGSGIARLDYDSVAMIDGRITQVIDDTSSVDAITPSTDVDHYFFNGLPGSSIRFNVLGQTNGLDPSIEVRDPTGVLVLDGATDAAGCTAAFNVICSFSVDMSPSESGTYTVLISDTGNNDAGNYQLSLWCLTANCDNDGDTIMDVNPKMLRYGESVDAGDITPAVDGEFFVFKGTPGDQIRFSVSGLTNGLDPTIEVRDPTGALVLDGAADLASCTAAFNVTCAFVVDFLPAIEGQFTLVLYDLGTDNAGNYQLTLECIFSPGDFVCENLPGRFSIDVPEDYWAFTFIEFLADFGITSGCAGDSYCPQDPVTRGQMSVFIERGINDGNFTPPACQGDVFGDVGLGNTFCGFIEQFFADGITSGCAPGLYCPQDSVTRAQMAVFLLRAMFGANHVPPAPTGVFTDVPVDFWAASWIEQLAAKGITSGCGEGIYCPDDPVTRDQMAVFVVRTFALGD